MFPHGFHPVRSKFTPDLRSIVVAVDRFTVSVKYYFTDFGLSKRYEPGEPRTAIGKVGLDLAPPELSDAVDYDPFKVDICVLGHVFENTICAVGALFFPRSLVSHAHTEIQQR